MYESIQRKQEIERQKEVYVEAYGEGLRELEEEETKDLRIEDVLKRIEKERSLTRCLIRQTNNGLDTFSVGENAFGDELWRGKQKSEEEEKIRVRVLMI